MEDHQQQEERQAEDECEHARDRVEVDLGDVRAVAALPVT